MLGTLTMELTIDALKNQLYVGQWDGTPLEDELTIDAFSFTSEKALQLVLRVW